jgi:hypothetical protein
MFETFEKCYYLQIMKLILASIVVLTFSSFVFGCGSLETELGVFEYQPSFKAFLGDDLALPEEKRLKNIKQLSFAATKFTR